MNALRRNRLIQAFEVALMDCLARMRAPTALAAFMSVWAHLAAAVLRRRSGEGIEGADAGALEVGDDPGYDCEPVLKGSGGDEPV